MKCRNIIHAEKLPITVPPIRHTYEDYCSVYFPISMDFVVPPLLMLQQEVMKCRNIIHVENLRNMVLPIRRTYRNYCSVCFSIYIHLVDLPYLVL
jgi:hypothetical protein